ncbi:class I fructose-bisphosphate aldolase [Aeromicrobium sp.]|uniref:class I fructose-bisphosphate aldolase n=1 Tax=Aeromicrobium sp. TaxID=1871063 RepID=UPI0025BBB88C|nr:class I fructose-bisphosphate aldolase [Aeromicrobium sp.]
MASKAASFMAHDRGVLVLDDYAHAAVTAPPWPGLSFDRYTELVLQSTGLSPFLSAVIVSPDTVLDGAPHLHGVEVGVRIRLPGGRTTGDLRRRLAAMASRKVKLAEWRANLPVGRVPRGGVHIAAAQLAAGAAASLAEGVTPILTVAMPDLESHSQGVTHAATANALMALSAALVNADVDTSAVLLRVNMIISGSTNRTQPPPFEVAQSTLAVLGESIADDFGGVLFLSSGQSLDQACRNLLAIADLAHQQSSPWPITFGFTRAVVDESLDVSEVRNEQLVHDALVRACDRASQSASGSTVGAAV